MYKIVAITLLIASGCMTEVDAMPELDQVDLKAEALTPVDAGPPDPFRVDPNLCLAEPGCPGGADGPPPLSEDVKKRIVKQITTKKNVFSIDPKEGCSGCNEF